MRPSLLFVVLSVAIPLKADDEVQRMTARVSEEAGAFARIAPQLLSRETLEQRAVKQPSRLKPRIGAAAQQPPAPQWQTRKIVSEYAYSTFADSPESIHEFRQALQVDGREVQKTAKALEALAKAISSTDDERKRRVLQDFQKLGLLGAVSDLGPMILLFTRRELEQYEFLPNRRVNLDGTEALVFSYKQVDGRDRMTVFEGPKADRTVRLKPTGEIWVRAADYVPLRITMNAVRTTNGGQFRDEMGVEYTMSKYGTLVPRKCAHREWLGPTLIAENTFVYDEFRRFGASSDIKFDAEPGKSLPAKPVQ